MPLVRPVISQLVAGTVTVHCFELSSTAVTRNVTGASPAPAPAATVMVALPSPATAAGLSGVAGRNTHCAEVKKAVRNGRPPSHAGHMPHVETAEYPFEMFQFAPAGPNVAKFDMSAFVTPVPTLVPEPDPLPGHAPKSHRAVLAASDDVPARPPIRVVRVTLLVDVAFAVPEGTPAEYAFAREPKARLPISPPTVTVEYALASPVPVDVAVPITLPVA